MGQQGSAASGEEGLGSDLYIQNAVALGGIWVLGELAMLGIGKLRNAFDEAASDRPDCWAMYGTEIRACE